MPKFSKLVTFIEMHAKQFPCPEWAIYCEALDLGLFEEMENALMCANNKHEFSYKKLLGYYINHE